MDSSKPVPTPKKISNKRVKRKHSDIDEDTTDPSKNYSMSDDGYKGGSESSNITETVSTNVNKDEKKKIKFVERSGFVKRQCADTEEKPQKVDTKSNHLMPIPLLKPDFQTYHNNRFIKECYLFHQLIMKKYNLTRHIHTYTDEELFSNHE